MHSSHTGARRTSRRSPSRDHQHGARGSTAERVYWPADDVFDAGMDSFPASDPPSWTPLRVGAPAA